MAANVKTNLESFGVHVDFISNDKNLIVKRRFVDTKSNQLLLREDIETVLQSISFLEVIKSLDCYDAIVISDYDKGLINNEEVIKLIKSFNGPVFVDSKKTDLSLYENCIIKINSEEENKVIKYPNKSEIIVTLGKHGAKYNDIYFSAPKVDVFDVTGAGDVFLASLCFYFLSTYNIKEAIKKAVILASKSVQHIGIYKLSNRDIEEVS
jgi:hydroxymethylpyrimidine/phosphomethylpyrimidine kinase